MDNIIQTLFCALLTENTSSSSFDTDITQKAFYSAYNKWVEMAEIEENIKAQNDVFNKLAALEDTERKQAFKVGLQTAFKLFISLAN